MDSLQDFIARATQVDRECFRGTLSDEGAVLGVHEGATKLWQSRFAQASPDVQAARVLNLLIGVLILAGRFEVADIADRLAHRLDELAAEPRREPANAPRQA